MANPQRTPRDEPRDVPRPRAALLAAGISDSQLRREHTRLVRGQWLHGSVRPELRHFLLAALQRGPDDAFLTLDTAATQHGGTVRPSGLIHLGTMSGRRLRVAGMMVHRYTQAPEIVMVHGLPATSKAQTFCELALSLGLVEQVVLGDSLSLGDPGLPDELRRHTAEASGRGIVAARRAAALVRAGAESAQETRSRLLLVLAGLPEPVLQHPMLDDRGREIHRLDLAYLEAMLALEYDGDHHLDRRQRDLDLLRRERFEALGWRFVNPVSADIYQRPAAFLERVRAAMRERGIVVPARLDPRWRLHFPP